MLERPEDVPLFAHAKMVAFLRHRYRRRYLEDVIPDLPNREAPGGNWYELVGSSYDRITYAFEIETSPEQDQGLIRKFINLYQPKALRRSYLADLGISTPEQMAKRLFNSATVIRSSDFRGSSFLRSLATSPAAKPYTA